jgi:peptidoglycan/LPS O-acetylase OafA/YrhL
VKHVRALDGIRGIAIGAVVLHHTGRLPSGFLGVNVFFTLSGFLITSLLIGEYSRTAQIRFTDFYLRRFFRLAPALLAALVLVGVIIATLSDVRHSISLPLPLVFSSIVLYMANWVDAFAPNRSGPMSHMWSLSVEEQFYLVWPPMLLAILRRKIDPRVLARRLLYGAAIIAVLRVPLGALLFPAHGDRFATFSQADGLLIGCALAVAVRYATLPAVGQWAGWLGAAIVAAALIVPFNNEQSGMYGEYTLVGLGSAAMIASAVTNEGALLAKLLSWLPLEYLGRISYGLYLYHVPIFYAVTTVVRGHFWPTVIQYVVTAIVTVSSYHFIEQPAIRGGRRYIARRSERQATVELSPAAAQS